jgi:hypothetical protein
MIKSGRIGILVIITIVIMVIAGCGGGGGGGGSSNTSNSGGEITTIKKASITGVVSFPALSSLVAKRAASTVIPPALTITDLSGSVVATPILTVDPVDSKKFMYAVSLDSSKNYVIKAFWGGQVMRSLADESTLSTLATVVNISPVSTAAVLVAEQKLSLTAGQLGTAAASSVTATQLGAVNPAALLLTIQNGATTTYAPLISEVTAALTLTIPQDPSTVAAVKTAVITAAPAYTAPPVFTLAMISGKSFKDASNVTITFNASGTVATSKNANTNFWILNADGTILLSYMDLTTNTSGWDKYTLVTDNSPTSLTISVLNISGTNYPNTTWTYYTPPVSGAPGGAVTAQW